MHEVEVGPGILVDCGGDFGGEDGCDCGGSVDGSFDCFGVEAGLKNGEGGSGGGFAGVGCGCGCVGGHLMSDEEDADAAGDGGSESVGVVEIGLEYSEPFC